MRTRPHPRPSTGADSDVVRERIAAFAADLLVLHGLLAVFASVAAGVGSAVLAVTGSSPAALAESLLGTTEPVAVVAALSAVLGVAMTVLATAYFVGLEWALGRTPGKMAMGLVVVAEDGSPPTLRASLVRNLLRVVDSMPNLYLVGLGAMVTTERTQRLGDLAGGTVVVRAAPRDDGEPAETRTPASTG